MRSLSEIAGAAAARWSRVYGVGVPPELVLAIIGVESHGDTLAVGAAGERGLMQVRESTARALGLKDPLELHVPEIGIQYGTQYLAQQLARYGGRIPNAVAAYNAGSAQFTQREAFVNQSYVDRVLMRFRQLKVPTPALAWLGVAAAGVTLWALSAGRK